MHKAVVISTDGKLSADLRSCGVETGLLDLVLEFEVPFRELTEAQTRKIRESGAAFVFIDLDDDPRTGCRVARYLGESSPAVRIVATGTNVEPSILVEAMRAGVSEFLEKPLSAEALDAAVGRLTRKRGDARKAPGDGAQVLFLFGAKGGVGTTTVATNLAIQLRRQTGQRVALVDLDLALGEIGLYLGIEPRYGIVDLAKNLHRLDEGLLASYIASHDSGVDVLSAPFDPDEARDLGAHEVERILRLLRRVYDFVVIDASNSLDARMLAGLRAADEVFVVTQVDVPSLRNIQRVRRVLKRVVPGRSPRVVINRFHSGGDITLRDVESALGLEVFWTLSNDYQAAVHSVNTGEPLVMSAPSVCEREVAGLVGKITGVEPQAEKQSWFSRLRERKRRPALRLLPLGILDAATQNLDDEDEEGTRPTPIEPALAGVES